MLMMFAPMIISQVRRYQRNKQRDQHTRPQRQRHLPEKKTGEYIKHEEVKKPYLEPDDPNAELTDDDIMLDPDDLKHIRVANESPVETKDSNSQLDHTEDNQSKNTKEKPKLDLKDFFLDKS